MAFYKPNRHWQELMPGNWVALIIFICLAILSLAFVTELMVHPFISGGLAIIVPLYSIFLYIRLSKTMVHVRSRKGANKFLIFASIVCVLIQVLTDMILSFTPVLWQQLIFDALYNIGFCMLFVFWFKWFDVVFLDFFNFDEDIADNKEKQQTDLL